MTETPRDWADEKAKAYFDGAGWNLPRAVETSLCTHFAAALREEREVAWMAIRDAGRLRAVLEEARGALTTGQYPQGLMARIDQELGGGA